MKKHFCSVLAAALVTLYFGTLGTVSADTVPTAEKEYLTRAEEIGLLEDFPIDSPDRAITRREFCELTDNLLDSLGITTENPTRAPFEDTFDTSVMRLYVAGIVKGTSETTFSPDDTLIRADAACLTARTAAFATLDCPKRLLRSLRKKFPITPSTTLVWSWPMDFLSARKTALSRMNRIPSSKA